MTAMKPVLDLFIDANILLVLAFVLWRGTQALIARTGMRHDYRRQLTLLKTFLVITILSPVLAHFGVILSQSLSPNTPLTVGDIAVAVYLQGDIAIPAVDFEAFLNTRSRVIETALEGGIPWMTALFAAIAAGSLYIVGRTVWSLGAVHRAISNSYLWRRTVKTDIRVSDTASVPFAARGLFRRHVVVPSSLLIEPGDLKLVLAHEFQHIRKADVEWELVFEFLRPLLYWNPAFALWKRHFDQLRELSCDQEVIRSRRVAPGEYARCLLDFCERRISGSWPRIMNVAFVRSGASRQAFEDRIMAMCHVPAEDSGRRLLPLFVLVLAAGVSLAAASVRQSNDWSHDRLMLSTVVNLERLNANPGSAGGFGVRP